jgi:hypothetical protein
MKSQSAYALLKGSRWVVRSATGTTLLQHSDQAPGTVAYTVPVAGCSVRYNARPGIKLLEHICMSEPVSITWWYPQLPSPLSAGLAGGPGPDT